MSVHRYLHAQLGFWKRSNSHAVYWLAVYPKQSVGEDWLQQIDDRDVLEIVWVGAAQQRDHEESEHDIQRRQ